MKPYRPYLFIAISSISLVVVLIIQVTWILKSAKVKEDIFNEKANMVLSRTVEALSEDKVTCLNIASCVQIDSASMEPAARIGLHETRKIDSLFTHFMKVYNVHVDYSFMIVNPRMFAQNGFTNYIYDKDMEHLVNDNRLQLNLIFPEKKQYIVAEMGPTFITSVILILVVLFAFWRTVLSLLKEKQISEHTTDFLNNMTHEFKTPLTNIALAGRMIVKDSTISQPDKVKHYSDIILDENERLRLQVEHVLSMTALERGDILLQKNSLDMHALINDAVKCMNVQIESKQGALRLKLVAKHSIIVGDKTHIINALSNLIDNAIKYCDKKPEIIIQTSNYEQHLVITISDNGAGIAKEYQKHVFNKFFRVPTGEVHDVKGFGLGLAYTQKIIELLSGTIELDSEKDKGTTFTLTMPNA